MTVVSPRRPFHRAGPFLAVVTLLAGCSSSASGAFTTTTHPSSKTSSDVTPCNYTNVWREDPSQFSEFGTLAHFGHAAADSDLRSEAEALTSALAENNEAAITDAMNKFATTCERLGLVRSPSSTSTTRG